MIPEELKTGHPDIDAQHARIMEQLALLKSVAGTEGVPEVGAVLEFIEFLRVHFAEHFVCEESLMRDADYPGWNEHSDIHRRFFDDFVFSRSCIAKYGATPERLSSFMRMAENWLADHVLGHDLEFARFLRGEPPSVSLRPLSEPRPLV